MLGVGRPRVMYHARALLLARALCRLYAGDCMGILAAFAPREPFRFAALSMFSHFSKALPQTAS